MAGSVNKVILVGNLGKDPEIRSVQDGSKIANLSLATSESWNDKASGERKDKTEWHRVVVFNDRIADVAERFLKKGSKVYIEGSLQTRKWTDNNGQERYSTEVVISRFNGALTLLDTRSGDSSSDDSSSRSASSSSRSGGRQSQPAGAGGNVDDDEIPF